MLNQKEQEECVEWEKILEERQVEQAELDLMLYNEAEKDSNLDNNYTEEYL